MTKIVINRCFGGAGLSKEAVEMLLARKGIEYDVVAGKSFGQLRESFYHKGHAGDDEFYISEYSLLDDRSDPLLVEVVEELGERANGAAADLAVIQIPDDVVWEIDEYDGRETVHERHRSWG